MLSLDCVAFLTLPAIGLSPNAQAKMKPTTTRGKAMLKPPLISKPSAPLPEAVAPHGNAELALRECAGIMTADKSARCAAEWQLSGYH